MIKKNVIIDISLLFVLILFLGILIFSTNRDFKKFGTNDFIEYYAANKAFNKGLNGYDPKVILELERSISSSRKEPMMMWNPPWTILLIKPILNFNFSFSASLWLFLNSILILIIPIIFLRAIGHKENTFFISIFSILFFPPLYLTLNLGQISTFIALGLTLFFYGIKKNKDILGGISLVLISIKPHFLYLFIPLILIFIFKEKRYKILYSLTISFSILLLFTYIKYPEQLFYYIDQITSEDRSLVLRVGDWITASTISVIRAYFVNNFHIPLNNLLIFSSIIISLIISIIFLRKDYSILNTKTFLTVLSISIITAPFVWPFDFVLLYLINTYIFHLISLKKQNIKTLIKIILPLILINISHYLTVKSFHLHHYLCWVPIAFLIYFYFSLNIIKKN